MTWVVPLALGGLAVLVMAVFTVLSARKRHHAVLAPATVVGPRVLIHDINDDRCTGCDACVAVCPTNVLDLVNNKSRVLRFQDCIQCEACMIACPTEALVMFPEGAHPPPLKVPEIDENFQTAVPGQYLIGEVAGKPLVKSAANLGRAVIEHMLATGLRPGALGRGDGSYDVAIVGSGPGGLSAALTCIQKGLSYIVLEKEQEIASTISRYPKGKLVMAEPYDTENVSLLPVFDSSKEQLIPIWKELLQRVGMKIHQGEAVETVQRTPDGVFVIATTVASYRAQRAVLSIGTRGKPRTLQVPGENLPKVFSLLEDPDLWRGKNVLVVGGGDSACEAALALSDAGAKVMISYRGKGFNRAAQKNKAAIEGYAAEGRIKAKLGSQVLQFDGESVTLSLADNTQKRYPNDAAFVLIGADPPVAWLEKVGIRFVERHHQFQLGKTDDIVRRYVRAAECPEDAARAAAQILGGNVSIEPMPAAQQPVQIEAKGPRKWLRSATSIFSTRSASQVGALPPPPKPQSRDPKTNSGAGGGSSSKKKLDAPMPLSEFAKRQRTQHTGHGRRDALSAGERTRILRMLRDEGGRLADEEQDDALYIGTAPGQGQNRKYDFDLDDSPAPAPAPVAPPRPTNVHQIPQRPRPEDVPAKPAVVVGLEKARQKRQSAGPPLPSRPPPSPSQPPPTPSRPPKPTKRPVPRPFEDGPTRNVDEDLLRQLRSSSNANAVPQVKRMPFDEPTKMADFDPRAFDAEAEATRHEPPDKFLPTTTEPNVDGLPPGLDDEEATALASVESFKAIQRSARPARPSPNDERTRAVDIRNDPSMSDVDWDLD